MNDDNLNLGEADLNDDVRISDSIIRLVGFGLAAIGAAAALISVL